MMRTTKQCRTVIVAACFAFVALALNAESGIFTTGYFTTSDADLRPGGVFYGYQKSGTGAGDNAFANCTNMVVASGRPMLLFWGKDSCSGCKNWVDAMNYHGRTAYRLLREYKFILAYFRGSETAPKAVKEAHDFFVNILGVARPSCHSVGFYGIAPNGKTFTRASTLVTGDGTMDGYDRAKDSFQKLYSRWSDDYEEFCSNNVVTVDTGFRVKDTLNDRLEVVRDVPAVHVPVRQTGSFDTTVTNLLEAAYPDGSAVTNEVVWTAGGPRQAVVEVALTNAVGGSVWTNGEGQVIRNFVRLTLMSDEGRLGEMELPTCDVHLVTTPANALDNPYLWGEKTAADLKWGEWTLDIDAATNRLQTSTLRLTGGVIWDPQVNAFMADVLNTSLFAAWCETCKVSTFVCDRADPQTGASLFTCNAASNTTKRSGTAYLSRHGLREGDYVSPAGDTFEIALLRADGSLAGRLAPQCKNGKYDLEENLARLTELLELADDPRETENDTAAGIVKSDNPVQYEVAYGVEPKSDDLVVNTLQISDKQDFFKITDLPANAPVTVEVRGSFGIEVPAVTLYRSTDAEATNLVELSAREYTFGTNVWCLTKQDVANGVFAKVSAWTDAAAAENTVCLNSSKNTTLAYTVVALPVEMPGSVGFTNAVEATYDVGGEREIDVTVLRSGVTGPATATVKLDAAATTVPDENFSWPNKNGQTNLTWAAGENGPKTITVKVHDVLWTDNDGSNIVFNIVAVSPETVKAEVGKTNCTLNIVQKYDPDALTGKMAIVDPTGPEIIYTNQKEISLTVRRMGERRTPEGRLEARGEAHAYLSTTAGTLADSQLDWQAWGTGDKTTTLTLPTDIDAKNGYQMLTVTLDGRDVDNKGIAVRGSNTVTICALPFGVPGFGPDFDSWNGVENVAFAERAELVNVGDWTTVESAVQLGGELPPGITCTADKAKPALVFSGTPTKPRATVYRSLWCLRLVRPSFTDSYAYTMPVTVEIAIKPLGDVNPWFKPSEESLYTEGNRIWNDLPLTNGEGRLTGLLNVSAAANGRFSARYRKLGGKSVAFAATAITQCDGENAYDGEWRVERTFDGNDYAVTVNLQHEGGFRAAVTDGERGETSAVGLAPKAGFWSRSHTAAPWTGDYTVAFVPTASCDFCRGAATASVRLPESGDFCGAATFAVTLPNGKAVSGATTLVPAPAGAEAAFLPVFWTSATEDFTAILKITPKADRAQGAVVAAEGVTATWHHEEPGAPEASYDLDYEVEGAQFADPGDWEAVWAEDYGTNVLTFACDDAVGPAVVEAIGEALKVAVKGDVRKDDAFQLNAFQLNRTTGVVAGTLCVWTGGMNPMTVSWKGVALPGLKPFVRGAYWYNGIWSDEDGETKRMVRRGGLIGLDKGE